jgi:putative transposase
MPRKGQSELKIVFALRQVEGGKKVADVCREMGVSQQTFYTWKKRYAGVGVSELRQLRDENRKLKTLVADLTLDSWTSTSCRKSYQKKSEVLGASRSGSSKSSQT